MTRSQQNFQTSGCSILKRRTVKVRVFPGDDALLRLVSAVLVEIDEKWASDTKAYIKWECQDA
jgi:Transposase, Mutator family.